MRQEAYERRMIALTLRRRGFKFREIGDVLGVIQERARQLVMKAKRDNIAPVVEYWDDEAKMLTQRPIAARKLMHLAGAIADAERVAPRDWLRVAS